MDARGRSHQGQPWSARICGFYAPERAVNLHVNVAMKRIITDLETWSDGELLEMVAGAAQ